MAQESIGSVLQYLMDRDEISITDLAAATGINRQTLYSMLKKTTSQADLFTLRELSAYFKEDISIFCGLSQYQKPIHLGDQEAFIITVFRKLNQTGQGRLYEYAQEIDGNPKYRK